MKQLTTLIPILLFLTLGVSQVWALPNCVGSWSVETWTNCYGTYVFGSDSEWAGDKYVGEWTDGKPNGHGIYIHSDGEKYVGESKDNNRSGYGTYIYSNGNKYVGEWKDGKKHGKGTFTFSDGTTYVGEWKNDNLKGY